MWLFLAGLALGCLVGYYAHVVLARLELRRIRRDIDSNSLEGP